MLFLGVEEGGGVDWGFFCFYFPSAAPLADSDDPSAAWGAGRGEDAALFFWDCGFLKREGGEGGGGGASSNLIQQPASS